MMVSLELFCSRWQARFIVEPPLGLELFGVGSPDLLRAIDSADRDGNGRASSNGDVVNDLT